jgi:hypothetical protein
VGQPWSFDALYRRMRCQVSYTWRNSDFFNDIARKPSFGLCRESWQFLLLHSCSTQKMKACASALLAG